MGKVTFLNQHLFFPPHFSYCLNSSFFRNYLGLDNIVSGCVLILHFEPELEPLCQVFLQFLSKLSGSETVTDAQIQALLIMDFSEVNGEMEEFSLICKL